MNEIAEIASMLLKPLQSSFHASKSARFESSLQQNGELTCETNQSSMHIPSCENLMNLMQSFGDIDYLLRSWI